MSMLDGFFSRGAFKGSKCKTLLKLTIPRIKLLRNRREIQLKHMRRDIAKLLENGQESTARIRVEHIIREENMMAAQEIVELFCELVAVRLPIIELQRECPIDLKEAISSICFAAPRCSDLPELQQIQMLFAAKYGREFVAAATELMPECGVNRQVIELLSVRAPSLEAKLKLLKEITEEHEVDWNPEEFEAELLKPHEDLLNGPSHLLGGPALPLPKHDDSLSSDPAEDSREEFGLDDDSDFLDLPEVPKALVQHSLGTPSAPESTSTLPHSTSLDSNLHLKNLKSTSFSEDIPHAPFMEDCVNKQEPSSTEIPYAPPNVLASTKENKQFIPFVSSPPLSPPSYSLNEKEHTSFSSTPVSQNQSKPSPSVSQMKSDANVDLQDVLAAAQAAAESAERAAAAARAAASLAQVRITELVSKRNDQTSEAENREKESHVNGLNQLDVHEGPVEQPNLSSHISNVSDNVPSWRLDSPTLSPHDIRKLEAESPDSKQKETGHLPAHQTRRLTSLEDDPYFSYPNLFSSQDSLPKSS